MKGGYFPVSPVDSLGDLRADMCKVLESLGQKVEVHHHEVANAGQCEIGVRFNTLVQKADELMTMKYVIKNVAHQNGKTATFMPKPIVGDNGSGMHVHQSLSKNGENLFAGDLYGGLSQLALWYIGGIFKHARAINAFANSTTNSYKRLVPGYEAPVMLAYSARNRSASCRIPYVASPGSSYRVRFPIDEPGYLVHRADDGRPRCILNKIDPGHRPKGSVRPAAGREKNIQVCSSLDCTEALADRDFKAGGVFTDDFIMPTSKQMKEVTRYRASTHPIEFRCTTASDRARHASNAPRWRPLLFPAKSRSAEDTTEIKGCVRCRGSITSNLTGRFISREGGRRNLLMLPVWSIVGGIIFIIFVASP